MRKNIFILLCFISSFAIAQTKGTPISFGKTYTLASKELNQDREIQVYLPVSYQNSKEKYPVLYILDGQWFFANGVGIQQSLRTPGAIPEMIVVGIKTKNPIRRRFYQREKEKFTRFLNNEVIAFIDSNYRTTNERVIYGWESAAYFISELILGKNNRFKGAIVTDGGYASEELIKKFNSSSDIYLFIANSKKDIYYIGSTEAFSKNLSKHQPKNLIWKYELFNDEVHETLPHLAMYKGIMYYYYNYDSLVFESMDAYEKAGGMAYLTSFFKERAKRFGGDGSIDDSTKNSLIWLAWRRNNFKYFSYFMNEFKEVLSTKRYASAYWQNRLGQFYLKHKDYKNAIIYFTRGLEKYPNTNFQKEMEEGLKNAKAKR